MKTTNYKAMLFCDLKTDVEKAEFIECGRAVETGIIAPAIAADVANAYRRAAKEADSRIDKQKPSTQ